MSEFSDRMKEEYPNHISNQNLDMVFASLGEKEQIELMERFESILYGERFYEYMRGIHDGIEIFQYEGIKDFYTFKRELDDILKVISQKSSSDYELLLNLFMNKYDSPDVNESYVFKRLYLYTDPTNYVCSKFAFLSKSNNAYLRKIPSFYYIQGLTDVAEKKYGSLSIIYRILSSLESDFVFNLTKSNNKIMKTIDDIFDNNLQNILVAYRTNLETLRNIELSDDQIKDELESIKPVLDVLKQCLVKKYVSSKDLGTV